MKTPCLKSTPPPPILSVSGNERPSSAAPPRGELAPTLSKVPAPKRLKTQPTIHALFGTAAAKAKEIEENMSPLESAAAERKRAEQKIQKAEAD